MRTPWKTTLRRAGWPAFGSLALALVVSAPRAADIVPVHRSHPGTMPAPGTVPEVPSAPAPAQDPQVAQLDQQIKAAREEYHSQLDPLQAQVKALREKYDPQIRSLEDQRWTLVEQGKSPEMQQLDAQERSALAALAEHEKADVDAAHQRCADQRRELQQKYADRRKELKGR